MHSAPARVCRALLWGSASALFFLLLSSLFRVDSVPAAVIAGLWAGAAFATWRPRPALMLIAALVPVATWTGRQWNGAVAWPETLVVAYLAGYTARRAFVRHPEPAGSLGLSIASMTAVVLASLAVRFFVLRETIGGEALAAHVRDLLGPNYFTGGSAVELDAAMRLVQGLLLLHAGTTAARASSSFAPQLIRCVVVGAALAGALNVWRVWLGALRLESPFLVFLRYLATLRFNTHYGDVNAAGSYFVMALMPALALCWRRGGWRWVAAVLPIALSLLLSGSRAAIVAGIAGAVATWYFARRATRAPLPVRTRRLAVPVALAFVVACAGAIYLVQSRSVTPATSALWIRGEFARTSLRMLEAAPVFGIGIGEYATRSGDFSSQELLTLYPPAEHENAHNNFLQVLSELGLVGFAAFVWVLGSAAMASAGQLAREPHNGLRWAANAGVLAFVISWLAGHPLLIDAPSFLFWLLLGTVSGWGEPGPQPAARRLAWTAAPALLSIILVASLPLRVRAGLWRAELEHQGIGLSTWRESEEGIRYRTGGITSTVFVPSSARVVTIPLRAAGGTREFVVELRLDGRIADVLRVPHDRWLMLQLPMPGAADGPRFRRLDLQVRSEDDVDSPVLMIGKVTPR